MLAYFLQGIILGFAYVAPIGMQNMYVINSSLNNKRWEAYKTAGITTFFDCSLAICCFFGIGSIIKESNIFRMLILCIGCIAVIYMGIRLITSSTEISNTLETDKSFIKTAIKSFTVTWVNPQAIIDGSLLLGGIRASLAGTSADLFMVGVCSASFLWFFGITTIISIFKSNFNNKSIKAINVICGAVIIYYGLKLGFAFLKLAIE
ncbi:LysE family transporter [Clostridium sp. cel8]|uniref:LysE/ArgO family amino acid transporter n=1 Tax=Clostridium sp. cel8 TaxID=2663123 RepID=UPI0015F6272A|nr:LysE family transporter [Clostridium sp. cel8]MBA5850156.1 LysE family transporter [Clostridium sp. cel8]